MRLMEALPHDWENMIEIPVAAVGPDGTQYPGTTSEAYLRTAFAQFVDLPVPLSEADYQALLAASTHNWQLNWRAFREQGII